MAGPFTNRSWRYCWNLIKQLYFFLPPHLKKKDKKKIHSVFLGINFSKSGLSHFCFSRKETNDKNLDLNTLQELYCKFFFRWYSYKNRFVTKCVDPVPEKLRSLFHVWIQARRHKMAESSLSEKEKKKRNRSRHFFPF